MLNVYQLFVVSVLLLGPGVVGPCVDCNQIWKFHCKVNFTGYYCEPGARITKNRIPLEDYRTSTIGTDGWTDPYDQCVPYPFQAEAIRTYCCFYSPELGCQLAINPAKLKYENRPVARCNSCSVHCRCQSSGTTPGQSWMVSCILGSLALSLMSRLIWLSSSSSIGIVL